MRRSPVPGKDRTAPPTRGASWCVVLGASLIASCLLTTSLDGLEGPPFSPDSGTPDTGPTEGGAVDGGASDASAGGADSDVDGDGRPVVEGGQDASDTDSSAGDGPIFDSKSDVGDGASKGPIPVADAGEVIRGIAAHGDAVYWVQGDPGGGIVRAAKTGGSQATFVEMTGDAFDVAVDDNEVYWSTGKRAEVFRKALGSSGPPTLFFPGARETLYLAVGGSGLLYVTGDNVVVVGPRDGGMSLVHYPSQPGSAGIASSGTRLFWSASAGIFRGDELRQPPQVVYGSAPGEIAGIATDGQEVFWMAPDGTVRALPIDNPALPPPREVCRANIERGDAQVDAWPDGGDGAAVLDVAVDDEWVYFAEPPQRRISKCAKR